jgi:hypothetical protein
MLHFNIYEIILNEIIKTYLGYDCARASLCGQKQAASAGFLGKARWIFFIGKALVSWTWWPTCLRGPSTAAPSPRAGPGGYGLAAI